MIRWPSTSGDNGWYLLQHPLVVLLLVALTIAIGVALWMAGSRREEQRQVTRYEFDDRDHLKAVPPRGGDE